MQLHTGILTRNTLISCMFVNYLEITFKRQFVCKFGNTEAPFYIVFNSIYAYVFPYFLLSRNIIIH